MMNSQKTNAIRRANKIEPHFIPYQRAIWKAKRLTHYRNMEEAEKKLAEFKAHILMLQTSVEEGEVELYQEKRHLMTLTLAQKVERDARLDKIASLEQKLVDAKAQLDLSQERFELLYSRFLGVH